MTKWLMRSNITHFNTCQQLPMSKKHTTSGQISAEVQHLLCKPAQTFSPLVKTDSLALNIGLAYHICTDEKEDTKNEKNRLRF